MWCCFHHQGDYTTRPDIHSRSGTLCKVTCPVYSTFNVQCTVAYTGHVIFDKVQETHGHV